VLFLSKKKAYPFTYLDALYLLRGQTMNNDVAIKIQASKLLLDEVVNTHEFEPGKGLAL
jgi:hypothetical protein